MSTHTCTSECGPIARVFQAELAACWCAGASPAMCTCSVTVVSLYLSVQLVNMQISCGYLVIGM